MDWLSFGVGVILGVFIFYLIFVKSSVGKLRIDRSDISDKPYMFLELSKPVSHVSSKKFVIFHVSNENFISQE